MLGAHRPRAAHARAKLVSTSVSIDIKVKRARPDSAPAPTSDRSSFTLVCTALAAGGAAPPSLSVAPAASATRSCSSRARSGSLEAVPQRAPPPRLLRRHAHWTSLAHRLATTRAPHPCRHPPLPSGRTLNRPSSPCAASATSSTRRVPSPTSCTSCAACSPRRQTRSRLALHWDAVTVGCGAMPVPRAWHMAAALGSQLLVFGVEFHATHGLAYTAVLGVSARKSSVGHSGVGLEWIDAWDCDGYVV